MTSPRYNAHEYIFAALIFNNFTCSRMWQLKEYSVMLASSFYEIYQQIYTIKLISKISVELVFVLCMLLHITLLYKQLCWINCCWRQFMQNIAFIIYIKKPQPYFFGEMDYLEESCKCMQKTQNCDYEGALYIKFYGLQIFYRVVFAVSNWTEKIRKNKTHAKISYFTVLC